MSDYIMLFRYTAQGVKNIKEASDRIKNVRNLFEQNGAKAKTFYGLLGQYDTMCIAEAPNDETLAKISLQISSLGNVQCETLRAFTEDQFLKIINQIS